MRQRVLGTRLKPQASSSLAHSWHPSWWQPGAASRVSNAKEVLASALFLTACLGDSLEQLGFSMSAFVKILYSQPWSEGSRAVAKHGALYNMTGGGLEPERGERTALREGRLPPTSSSAAALFLSYSLQDVLCWARLPAAWPADRPRVKGLLHTPAPAAAISCNPAVRKSSSFTSLLSKVLTPPCASPPLIALLCGCTPWQASHPADPVESIQREAYIQTSCFEPSPSACITIDSCRLPLCQLFSVIGLTWLSTCCVRNSPQLAMYLALARLLESGAPGWQCLQGRQIPRLSAGGSSWGQPLWASQVKGRSHQQGSAFLIEFPVRCSTVLGAFYKHHTKITAEASPPSLHPPCSASFCGRGAPACRGDRTGVQEGPD